jgi:glycosyltransferase involved in cell wall biosynthesis
MITIITPSFNPGEQILGLAESLRLQTRRNFEWLVLDGGSTDGTVAKLESYRDVPSRVSVQPDFGIYDALNRGIRLASTDYYLAVGADDRLQPDAVEQYTAIARTSDADIISAVVRTPVGSLHPGRGDPWKLGHLAFVSQHAVGSLIRKTLHDRFGMYTSRFPIAADHYFLLKACLDPNVRLHKASFVAGTYGVSGVSARDTIGTLTEFYRVQVELLPRPTRQTLVLMWRLLRSLSRAD